MLVLFLVFSLIVGDLTQTDFLPELLVDLFLGFSLYNVVCNVYL